MAGITQAPGALPALGTRVEGPSQHTLRLLLISYQDYHMLCLSSLRKVHISYQDYRMLFLTLAGRAGVEAVLAALAASAGVGGPVRHTLRRLLISYQDYHMLRCSS